MFQSTKIHHFLNYYIQEFRVNEEYKKNIEPFPFLFGKSFNAPTLRLFHPDLIAKREFINIKKEWNDLVDQLIDSGLFLIAFTVLTFLSFGFLSVIPNITIGVDWFIYLFVWFSITLFKILSFKNIHNILLKEDKHYSHLFRISQENRTLHFFRNNKTSKISIL